MTNLQQLEKRVSRLEAVIETQNYVMNHLMETIYEPEFIKKLDKLAEYGNGKEETGG